MQRELTVKGKSLTGTSDLTLLAPIIPGFVPSLDALTYKTRAKRLMKSLTGGRASLHEYALYRPISDSVERVAVIQSFRVTVVEPEDKILLAVTFDGTWESYIRILWQKVGTLLDIIFCNTEGYVNSQSAGFEAWAGWVRRVQIETDFYYNTHGLTVPDVAYLRGEEAIHRLAPDAASRDLLATRQHVRTAEQLAWAASRGSTNARLETLRQGLQSLAVLFRMTDMYLPGTADGDVLKRAACDLLLEFRAVLAEMPREIVEKMRQRFARQMDWLASGDEASPPPRPSPQLPDVAPTDMLDNIQVGILRSLEGMTHGCMLLIAIDDAASGAAFLETLLERVTTEAGRPGPGQRVTVFAFSYEGLRALGLSEDQLALLPQEFREGMEARSSVLGDFRNNHPRRWRLPQANWSPAGQPSMQRVQMSAVHLVVQMRVGSPSPQHDPLQADHPLHEAIKTLMCQPGSDLPRKGVRLLAVEAMRKHTLADGRATEHFGFVDGFSDPVFNKAEGGSVYPNHLPVGEFLWGRDTAADVAPPSGTPQERERMKLLGDASFLAVRKLKQNVDVLHNVVRQAAKDTGLGHELILAKMMGRGRDGKSLVDERTANDFDYSGDTQGKLCPFHAHVRRANPRAGAASPVGVPERDGPPEPAGGRPPRILRRGMSYGPLYQAPGPDEEAKPDGVERGMMFIAYCSSLSEQFETVQRWLTGGNSAGGYSRHSDPFMGVPEVRGPANQGEPFDERRGLRFEHEDQVHRIGLDEAPALDAQPRPVVQLEWGIYLLAPSITSARHVLEIARHARPRPVWSAAEGEKLLQALLAREKSLGKDDARLAWKELLEDPEAQEKYRSAGVWAAIREHHGGVLRTAYGLIVADREKVMEVLGDDKRFSVAGYLPRMTPSIGQIYLGLDDGPAYRRQSGPANAAIGALAEKDVFQATLGYTRAVLAAYVKGEKALAQLKGTTRWELNLDAKEVSDQVLAMLCQDWFGLPDDKNHTVIQPGSWRWDWKPDQPPIYPPQFTAPSRYIFQPWPNQNVEDYATRMGRALTAALGVFIAPHRAAGSVPQNRFGHDAPLTRAVLAAFPRRKDDDLVARTLSGMLMGFLPTVDGNFRLSLNEWLRDGTFWSLRAAWAAAPSTAYPDLLSKAHAVLLPALSQAMQLRPAPEVVWRTARKGGFAIGGEKVRRGDVVVASLVSAAHQCLAENTTDLSIVFGGRRCPMHGAGPAQAPASPAPTHACPGYDAGMGVLLGLLAGLIDQGDFTRPSPAPLSFTFEGVVEPPPPAAPPSAAPAAEGAPVAAG